MKNSPTIKDYKCKCGKPFNWKNIKWDKTFTTYHICQCGNINIDLPPIFAVKVKEFISATNNVHKMKLFVTLWLDEKWVEIDKEKS